MADIFISYSSKDKAKAHELSELLVSSGISVWIDQSGIAAATSWSKEIAEALEGCSAFILLLSANSIASENVAKELAVAAKLRKQIIPVQLERVELKGEFLYHLTTLQHVEITNVDAIIHAVEKHRRSAAIASPSIPQPTLTSNELRIAVLPFEDQSQAHDNEWFSDGLTDELIGTLGKLDKLFVVDSQSSKIYKNAKLPTKEIAKQLDVRYIVHGAVRKAGQDIRIQASLIDTSTGATLWAQKFSGVMDDIFEIQEKTAIDITQGLQLKLTKDEVAETRERGTDSVEAYELYLRAVMISIGMAKEDQIQSIEMLKQAIALDPNYLKAQAFLAISYANYYRSEGRQPEILELQRAATERTAALSPEDPSTYNTLANLFLNLGEKDKAIEMANNMIRVAPKRFNGYSVMGFMLMHADKVSQAVKYFEQALTIAPASIRDYSNLVRCYLYLGDKEQLKKTIIRASQHFEQYLALQPEDQSVRVEFMLQLEVIGRHDLATREAEILLRLPDLYGHSYYQISSVYAKEGDTAKGIELLRKAAEKGFINLDELRNDKEWFGNLHSLPNFEELVKELEEIVAKANG